jgi:hypothetical protein
MNQAQAIDLLGLFLFGVNKLPAPLPAAAAECAALFLGSAAKVSHDIACATLGDTRIKPLDPRGACAGG